MSPARPRHDSHQRRRRPSRPVVAGPRLGRVAPAERTEPAPRSATRDGPGATESAPSSSTRTSSGVTVTAAAFTTTEVGGLAASTGAGTGPQATGRRTPSPRCFRWRWLRRLSARLLRVISDVARRALEPGRQRCFRRSRMRRIRACSRQHNSVRDRPAMGFCATRVGAVAALSLPRASKLAQKVTRVP